jgi:Fic family protein
MFIPEYTITSQILSNIANIEYGKAIVETRKILPSWKRQLQKEARTRFMFSAGYDMGVNIRFERIKRIVDGLEKPQVQELINLQDALESVQEISQAKDLEENDLKLLHRTIAEGLLPKTRQGKYRSTKIKGKTNPDELLAQMVELFDWLNSLDAKETHPILTAGIFKAVLEITQPFETYNSAVADTASTLLLTMTNYDMGNVISVIDYYDKTKRQYEDNIYSLTDSEADLTKWLEYYTEGLASEVSTLKEKVQLLARDTKLAKATGRAKLTGRQEKIVEYLQDYGIIRNKDFSTLLPKVSEDTVLRDLKVLIDEGIVAKRGSTKSSRYELS